MTKPLRRPSAGRASVGKTRASAAPGAGTSLPADHVAAVMVRAKESGLTSSKAGRISGRVSPELIERAKARTGIRSDTELVAFALANVAIEDEFVRVFRDARGTVDPDLDLDF